MMERRLRVLLVFAALAGSHVASSRAAVPAGSLSHLLKQATALEDWLVGIRRTLHKIPELLFAEHATGEVIRRHLDELGIPYQFPVAKTGVVASIGQGAPVVVLRSDIDALPIQEEDEKLEFASNNPGRMHACGHDAHMTMLLGAAKMLKGMEKELKGTVRLLFQPAEEGGAGGDLMVKEGALADVEAAFALHVWPSLPSGVIASRPGTLLAGAIQFQVTVKGRGGHAAIPHLTSDPVVAAAAAVSGLQALVARETSPFDSAVISVTRLAGGNAYNVVPDEASFGGTMRSNTDQGMQRLRRRLEELVAATAAAHGCTAEVDWMQEEMPYYPPTVNDPATFQFAMDVAGRLSDGSGGIARVGETEATMAGEDFSFIARTVPSCFTFLGTRNESLGAVHGLHTPRFTLDEGVLKVGAALHTALASEYLEQWHSRVQARAREEL